MDDEEFESLPTAERQRIMGMLQQNPMADPESEEPQGGVPELTDELKRSSQLMHEVSRRHGIPVPNIEWLEEYLGDAK